MSRLQAGGLALYIPNGVVCKLIEYIGTHLSSNGEFSYDAWEIEPSEPMPDSHTGKILDRGVTESKYLMPLGDKQTQDELAKELEVVK